MLNLEQMRRAEPRDRRKIVIERLAEEVPEILRKYSIQDFDHARFFADLTNWLKDIGIP
jgi:hypothetical protein